MDTNIQHLIDAELDLHNLTRADLTPEQMTALEEECRIKLSGGMIIDGILTDIDPYRKPQTDKPS